MNDVNTITAVHVIDRVLDPMQAELWVRVEVAHRSPATDVRGRFVGPRCPGATTVEVAYPLRPLRGEGEPDNVLLRRVIIPEPSFWDTESPFTYEAIVELWEGAQLVDERRFPHALKKGPPRG